MSEPTATPEQIATSDRALEFTALYADRMSPELRRGLHLALVMDFDRASAVIKKLYGDPAPIAPEPAPDQPTPEDEA